MISWILICRDGVLGRIMEPQGIFERWRLVFFEVILLLSVSQRDSKTRSALVVAGAGLIVEDLE